MQHFDIVALEKSVDWFNIMTYDRKPLNLFHD